MANGTLLEAHHVTIRFGGLTAVSDFNLAIGPHELVGLIGPNGAGKTTIFNMLTGVYKPTEGDITIGGTPTREMKPYQITSLGIARTFQNIHDRAPDRDALHLAARQLIRKMRRAMFEPDALQHFPHALVHFALRPARERQRKRHVLEHVQRRNKIEELEDESDRYAPQRRQLRFVER